MIFKLKLQKREVKNADAALLYSHPLQGMEVVECASLNGVDFVVVELTAKEKKKKTLE